MKKIIVIILAIIILMCTFSSCSPKEDENDTQKTNEQSTLKENDENGVKIPEILGTDIESAKTIVLNMGLVPVIQEEFSDSYKKDCVVGCQPEIGTTIEKGSSVNIIVSKGPSVVVSKATEGTLDCYKHHVIAMDGWGIVYAEISNITNTLNVTLQINGLTVNNDEDDKWLIAASGNDSFASLSPDFTVISRASYVNTATAYTNTTYNSVNDFDTYQQTVNINIPLDVFQTELPTTMWIRLPAVSDFWDEQTLVFKLNFTWDGYNNSIEENIDYDNNEIF